MKENKGITLIALIITIIILLILVGVSLNLVIKGDLFGSAEKAVEGTNAKTEQEQTRVDELMEKLNKMNDNEKTSSTINDTDDGIELIKTALGENGIEGIVDIFEILKNLKETIVIEVNEEITDAKRTEIVAKTKTALTSIDNIVSKSKYKGDLLLTGNIARDFAIENMFLSIDDLSTNALGLNINDVDSELATEAKMSQYIDKIDGAIEKVRLNLTNSEAVLSGLDYALDYHIEEKNILNSTVANMDKKLARNGLETIRLILSSALEKTENASNDTNTDSDRQVVASEIEKNFVVIEHISENCKYNEQKLLDGTYINISKINLTTLGGGTKLSSDVSTKEKAETQKPKYQSALEIIEREIAKLD